MALSKLDSLYMAVISDHSKHPHHHGRIEDVNHINMNNPTCGDVISLSVAFEDDRITDIKFAGEGCSISTASSSMMTDSVIGKTIDQALEMTETFSEMVQGRSDDKQKALGEAALLAGVAKFPQRVKCAMLGWNALKRAIEEEQASK